MDNNKTLNKNSAAESNAANTSDEALPVHNPLKEGDFKQITEQDVENEQKFKEALTERD